MLQIRQQSQHLQYLENVITSESYSLQEKMTAVSLLAQLVRVWPVAHWESACLARRRLQNRTLSGPPKFSSVLS